MFLLSEPEARALIDKILALSTADETSVTLSGGRTGNIRYARNSVTTSGEKEDRVATITVAFGKRSGSASTNEWTDDALRAAVRQAEETARLAPENPEFLPAPGPQNYGTAANFSAGTAAMTPARRAALALAALNVTRSGSLSGAGYLEDTTSFTALGNSRGLFAYNRGTVAGFTASARTGDGTGSGYAARTYTDVSELDAGAAARMAAQKALASRNARTLPPGKYTVILEPAAVADFLPFFLSALDARNADEGRSYFGKKGGGNRLGEKLFADGITLYTDPFNARVPGRPFAADGRPVERTAWVEQGVLRNFHYSRYWAGKQGVKAVPLTSESLILQGSDRSLEDLIKGSDKTILVTRCFYMRSVDPQSILVTGLTRDGVFWIENGKIAHAVKNFRFNESPVNLFRNLEDLGRAERVGASLVPPLKVRDFNFSSLSDAV
ncbi:TldD/PmbA family protein [Flaviaesturariibacter amylovorans]|uniref:TldD/PmbA family protein n=1 Tax=Flaviaesturariibacter amylovorans TaxID=1084520 RepID=A0ABP8HJI6_9BACT